MPTPRVLVLRAPGTNCDAETGYAFDHAGAKADLIHVNRLLEDPSLPDQYQILCVPGGFSYGDDVGAGRILAEQIRHHLADVFNAFKDAEKLILGICNGFQVLIKSGILLPDDPKKGPAATLTLNDSGKFEDRWIHLKVDGSQCVFFEGIERLYLPVAHAEGKFVARDQAAFDWLDVQGQLVLRYSAQNGSGDGRVPYPENPNGSMGDVAGLCDHTGRVLGLMPHPERHIDPTQHPRWTRGEAGEVGDGLAVFKNAVNYFAG
jgi:phosphoribosylformylglycinamidine synthase I